MARMKCSPGVRNLRMQVGRRFSQFRALLFGERGGAGLGRSLGVPTRTIYNYEGGVTMPAEVMLKTIAAGASPLWMLTGEGEPLLTAEQWEALGFSRDVLARLKITDLPRLPTGSSTPTFQPRANCECVPAGTPLNLSQAGVVSMNDGVEYLLMSRTHSTAAPGAGDAESVG